MTDVSGDRGRAGPRTEYHLLVATHVVRALVGLGVRTVGIEELLGDPGLRQRDLALLGLGSLDWIALAVRLESETGAELPDVFLLKPENRSVDRWAEALSVVVSSRTSREQQPNLWRDWE